MLLSLVVGLVSPAGPAVASVDAVAGPTGSISGTVTVPAGADVTEVYVRVGHFDLSGEAGSTSAAEDGSYTVDGLAAGTYYVEFNGWNVGLIRQLWKGTPYWERTTPVTVGSSAVAGIDATMRKGATVSGTIHTTSGCDLTGVHVYLWGAPGQSVPDSVVQPNGHWTVRGVPTGSFWVEFEGRYVGLSREYWDGFNSPELRSWLPLIAGKTTTGVDMTLTSPQGCVALVPYVTQVYRDLLRRQPDRNGLDTWVRLLVDGAPYTSVANSITASDEYRARLVRATYRTYLGRRAEAAGVTFWLGQMRAGRQIEEIQAGFIASDEFYARYGSTPAGWVKGLYQTVLHRNPTRAEVQWWVTGFGRGMPRSTVARGFLYSTEHLTSVVDGYYVDLLGRHIDRSGKATWVGLIQQGHRDEEIVAAIVSSEEYRASVER